MSQLPNDDEEASFLSYRTQKSTAATLGIDEKKERQRLSQQRTSLARDLLQSESQEVVRSSRSKRESELLQLLLKREEELRKRESELERLAILN